MAGTNKVLKEGQVLFKAGDKSDGMYLIRRGELRVYLEQDGKEVSLASVGEGGMIGEMALFDNQPRSASVKASKECEVTLISQDEFSKLMKQIPKWFVGLMSALSSRLRQTNERLKNLESTGSPGSPAASAKNKAPFQAVVRQLHVMILLFHKDGQKDGKDWVLSKAPIEASLIDLFNEDPEKLKALLQLLVQHKLLTTRQDTYKNTVLSMPNRAALGNLVAFLNQFVKANPECPYLTDDAVAMLRIMERVTLASPYDTSTVSLADLIKEGKRDGKNTSNWEKALNGLQRAGEEMRVVKTSSGPGLKANKKDVAGFVMHCQLLAALYKANLM